MTRFTGPSFPGQCWPGGAQHQPGDTPGPPMARNPRGAGFGDRVHGADLDAFTTPRAPVSEDDQGAMQGAYCMDRTGQQACAAPLAGANRHGCHRYPLGVIIRQATLSVLVEPTITTLSMSTAAGSSSARVVSRTRCPGR